MERKKKKEGSGFYIAVCCCIVIIAIVGYANRMSLEDSKPEQRTAEKIEATQRPVFTPKPIPTEAPAATSAPAEDNTAVSKNVKTEEKIQFNAPVGGKVIEEYTGDDLVYNEALKDWRAHSGVDFSADMGEQVLCCANGVVEEVFDSNMGRCVIIDHKNGFKTMYANLNENTQVSEGDEVAQGEVIGIVGDTALGDSTDEPHLHFEMTMNNKNVNPVDYLE